MCKGLSIIFLDLRHVRVFIAYTVNTVDRSWAFHDED